MPKKKAVEVVPTPSPPKKKRGRPPKTTLVVQEDGGNAPEAPPSAGGIAVHCAHTEIVPVETLVPHPRNPNKHPDEQIRMLGKIIAYQGWRNPIVVSTRSGFVIKGHGRLMAALNEGWSHVPVDRQNYATEADEWADMVADNRIAELAEPDAEMTLGLIGDLGDGFDAELMGYDADSISSLGQIDTSAAELENALSGGCEGEDDLPDAPARVHSGEIWVLGKHRLICGDSTLPETVNRLMAGATADIIFTSPPYDQQRDYTQKITDWQALMRGVFTVMPMSENTQVLVNLGLVHRDGEWQPYWDPWIEWMRMQGWRRFGWYVWDQGPGMPGDWAGRLAPSHEFVFHFNREAQKPNKTKATKTAGQVTHKKSMGGLRRADGHVSAWAHGASPTQAAKIPDSVIRTMRHKGSSGGHPAPFSVGFASEICAAFTSNGGVIYEPFSGSGTSIIAAEKLGRRCYASEIEPKYCDIAIARWEKLTGKEALRA